MSSSCASQQSNKGWRRSQTEETVAWRHGQQVTAGCGRNWRLGGAPFFFRFGTFRSQEGSEWTRFDKMVQNQRLPARGEPSSTGSSNIPPKKGATGEIRILL